MQRRAMILSLGGFLIASPLLSGCDGPKEGTTTEKHDQVGEHLNYPAGGPNSPDNKKFQAKKVAAPAPKS